MAVGLSLQTRFPFSPLSRLCRFYSAPVSGYFFIVYCLLFFFFFVFFPSLSLSSLLFRFEELSLHRGRIRRSHRGSGCIFRHQWRGIHACIMSDEDEDGDGQHPGWVHILSLGFLEEILTEQVCSYNVYLCVLI
ncbi:hypothetical protein BO94DRAFT_285083 [Aspergillus sclerotioniger CBS 115572]|uniref:Uncharacterized protein n=1 Tax=Aspergillus sclerotioniger CBS 115572 TaxID=1450535 RepID=A0A317X8E7_9EURO|nr:hypothetical protein BO94DRAFT_285083 [Aspergillus sclerotioniger CBS 115572]PWY94809.1 hypothetical protein BO94DRAFT_285083 [Aspergillus sclerotioniger CBS 115572]